MTQQFKAWTDGSANNRNPLRPGGSAYIIFDGRGREYKRMSKGFMHTTNNRMEQLAIISVVNSLPYGSTVTIHTDSQYCITALNAKRPKKNLDQIALFHRICKQNRVTVKFRHVKGHSGDKYNEECDRMARREYSRMASSIDETYYSCITTKNSVRNAKRR